MNLYRAQSEPRLQMSRKIEAHTHRWHCGGYLSEASNLWAADQRMRLLGEGYYVPLNYFRHEVDFPLAGR